MKIRLVPRHQPDLSPRLAPTTSLMAAHGMPTLPEFMRPNAPLPRPPGVGQLAWESLAIHVDDARRGGSIASPAMRDAVNTVVRELRVACLAWEDVYSILGAAGMAGSARAVAHSLELELHASRGAAIVAHMHSWADVLRLAEIDDPCEEPG